MTVSELVILYLSVVTSPSYINWRLAVLLASLGTPLVFTLLLILINITRMLCARDFL